MNRSRSARRTPRYREAARPPAAADGRRDHAAGIDVLGLGNLRLLVNFLDEPLLGLFLVEKRLNDDIWNRWQQFDRNGPQDDQYRDVDDDRGGES